MFLYFNYKWTRNLPIGKKNLRIPWEQQIQEFRILKSNVYSINLKFEDILRCSNSYSRIQLVAAVSFDMQLQLANDKNYKSDDIETCQGDTLTMLQLPLAASATSEATTAATCNGNNSNSNNNDNNSMSKVHWRLKSGLAGSQLCQEPLTTATRTVGQTDKPTKKLRLTDACTVLQLAACFCWACDVVVVYVCCDIVSKSSSWLAQAGKQWAWKQLSQ